MGCPGQVHEHTFATEWTSNDTHHWHAATCEHTEEVSDNTPHTYGDWTIIKQPSEESAGSRERICEVCGIVEAEELAKLDHVHRLGTHHAAVAGTCRTKGIVEYYDCAKETCQVKLDKDGNPLDTTEGELDPSNHEGTTAWTKTDSTHTEIYGCCEAVKTAEAEHTWNVGVVTTVPTLVEEGVKTYTCTECGETKTENISAYGWCESPVDAVTGLAATSNSTYVYFGVFPRTVLPLDSTVTVDENDKVEMGANTYYKGSDGEYYTKALENAYGTGALYKYKNGEQAKQKSEGSYRYFKVEPIKWKVLTTTYDIDGESGNATGALLLAEDILTANIPYYEDKDNNRTINGKTVYPNNYKHSQIRAYLNGLTYQGQSGEETKWNGNGFLQTAFTEAAQEKISTTEVDNRAETTGYSEDTYATDYACENTNDKIFLLSESEVINSSYGFAAYDSSGEGNARIRMPTDYAKANYVYQYYFTGSAGYWWLRSPCFFNSYLARKVNNSGHAYDRSDVDGTAYGGGWFQLCQFRFNEIDCNSRFARLLIGNY